MLQHALNVHKTARLNIFGIVEKVGKAIASLYMQLHVAFDYAIFLHVLFEESQLMFIVENASAIGDWKRSDGIWAISSFGSHLNKNFLFMRQHTFNRSHRWKQIRFVYENFYSFTIHRRHCIVFNQRIKNDRKTEIRSEELCVSNLLSFAGCCGTGRLQHVESTAKALISFRSRKYFFAIGDLSFPAASVK